MRRSACTRWRSPSTATPSRSTSGRRRSPRACGSARRPRRCAGSSRRTCARSARSSSRRSTRRPTCRPCAGAPASFWRPGRSTRRSLMAIRSSEQLVLVDHPLAQHKLALIRDRTTTTRDFRWLMGELAAFLCYEATRDLELEQIDVATPLETARGAQISGKKLGVVAVLRAGLGMLDAVLDLVPVARVGFVGIYRDESTLEPVEYYCKLPGDLDERDVLVPDQMLATGGSASAALRLIKERGSRSIRPLSVVAVSLKKQHIATDHQSST